MTLVKLSYFLKGYMKKILLLFASTLFFLCSSSAPPYAAVLKVPAEYEGIQEAINASADGDIIIVGKGTYRENIMIRKAISIRSSGGADSTVVEAGVRSKPVVSIEGAKNVTLIGFTLKGSDLSGILIKDSSSSRIINNRAVKNANGILVFSSTRSKLFNNNFDSNSSYGVYLEKSTYNNLKENTMSSNGDKGLFLSYSNNNVVTRNSANLNTWNGILVWTSNNNTIEENRTLRNTYGLVIAESSGNIFSGNVTLPNIFIIMPVLLIYAGVIVYMIQKQVIHLIYGE